MDMISRSPSTFDHFYNGDYLLFKKINCRLSHLKVTNKCEETNSAGKKLHVVKIDSQLDYIPSFNLIMYVISMLAHRLRRWPNIKTTYTWYFINLVFSFTLRCEWRH